MSTRKHTLATFAAAAAFAAPIPAQTQGDAINNYLAQSIPSSSDPDSLTIDGWTRSHPGERVESPSDVDPDHSQDDPRQIQDRRLAGRWCLRSQADIDLGDGVHIHRTALFYPPYIEDTWDKPLPPLPTESGDALRRHGCRLVRVMSEFEGFNNPHDFAETLASQLPGKREDEQVHFLPQPSDNDFWTPLLTLDDPSADWFSVYFHQPASQPFVLLDWRRSTLDYGSPSGNTVDPEAGQPRLPIRAAMLANMPQGPTLKMLSFLAPQVGGWTEQPPFHCDRDLLPVLRNWFAIAARKPATDHAAALLLADRVAGRLSECDEFNDSESDQLSESDQNSQTAPDSLESGMAKLGIEIETPARIGPKYYNGNLLAQVRKFAPEGPVNELSWVAQLDQRCGWSRDSGADCDSFIQSGEDFLKRFPPDEWTPTVHLLLAEACTLDFENFYVGNSSSLDSPAEADKLLLKAAQHYRAWYANSDIDRNRRLVWEEIWSLEAGLGPWLMVPGELKD